MRAYEVHQFVGLHDCAGLGQTGDLGTLFGRGEGTLHLAKRRRISALLPRER